MNGCLESLYEDQPSSENKSYLALPNKVKGIVPQNGVKNVVVESDIFIRFYRPMNQETVAANLFIKPDVNYTLTWPEPNLLKITPDPAFKFDTEYKLTIKTSALDKKGNRLEEEFVSKFITQIGPPFVLQTNPANNQSQVKTNTSITIYFNEPVNSAMAINAFNISPETTGSFEFISKQMIFKPTAPLKNATKYQITLSSSLTDLIGNSLIATYEFSFITEDNSDKTPPSVLWVESIDKNFVKLKFSEPVRKSTAEDYSNYSIDNGLIITNLQLDNSDTLLTMETTTQQEGTSYHITLSHIKDLAGNIITEKETVGFTGVVRPEVTSVFALSNTSIVVYFSKKLDKASAEKPENYTINPYLKVDNAVLQSDNSSVLIETTAQNEDTLYTVYVKNIKDEKGYEISLFHFSGTFFGIP